VTAPSLLNFPTTSRPPPSSWSRGSGEASRRRRSPATRPSAPATGTGSPSWRRRLPCTSGCGLARMQRLASVGD
jgi:hypothetical protein